MKHFNSKPIKLKKPAAAIFERLSDFNNFKNLLPKDKIEDFDCTATTCKITLKGGQSIFLERQEYIKDKKIVYGTKDAKPIEMAFGFDIDTVSDEMSEVIINIDAKIDGFMAGIVSKPLQNMLDMMSEKMETIDV